MGLLEKIKAIEDEMARTQKNKATNYHLGILKAKLSKLRSELMEPRGGKGATGEGFDVMKSGDARVALIGFPSVGKSTMLSTVTKTESAAAAYEFTTLTCIPGVIEYNESKIQLLDLPGIIEGAAKGKGRGRQVIAVARTADMVLMMLDASKAQIQKELLTKELESVGIRINRTIPDISVRIKKGGGVSINSTCDLTYIDLHLVRTILHEYKLFNVDILFRCIPHEDEILTRYGFVNHDQMLDLFNIYDEVPVAEYDPVNDRINYVLIKRENVVESHANAWVDLYSEGKEEDSSSSAGKLHHVLRVTDNHKMYAEYSTANADGEGRDYRWRETIRSNGPDRYCEAEAELRADQLVPNLSSTWKPTESNSENLPVLAWRLPSVAGFTNELDWTNNCYDLVNHPALLQLEPKLASLRDLLSAGFGIVDKICEHKFMQSPWSGPKYREQRFLFEAEMEQYDAHVTRSMNTNAQKDAGALQTLLDADVSKVDFSCSPLPATAAMKQKAFLQLYGFYLGDGTLNFNTSPPHIVFCQSKPFALQWIINRLNIVGSPFTVSSIPSKTDSAAYEIHCLDPSMNAFFGAEYKFKYNPSGSFQSKSEYLPKLILETQGALLAEMKHSASTVSAAAPNPARISTPSTSNDSASPATPARTIPQRLHASDYNCDWESCGSWLAVWVWKLSALQKRYLLEGLIWADGSMNSWIEHGEISIYTSSNHFRDELVRLVIEAGYSSRFTENADGGECGNFAKYTIHGSELKRKMVFAAEDRLIRKVTPTQPELCWCVTLPAHTTKRIIVRRAPIGNESTYPVSVGNCDATVDEFIDVIEGNRKYLKCLYVINKVDTISLDECDWFAHEKDTVVVSMQHKFNLDFLLEKIWEYLDFIRIYTKPKGKKPSFSEPLILKSGSSVESVCNKIHREMVAKFKYALVWGTSTKHQPQRVGLSHIVEDEDVVQIMTK